MNLVIKGNLFGLYFTVKLSFPGTYSEDIITS